MYGIQTPAERALRLLYLPWAWLVFAPITVASTLLLATLAWLLTHLHPNCAFYVAKVWGAFLCSLNFTAVRVRGMHNIEPGRPYVIMCNHQSYFDTLALCARMPVEYRWVMKKELRKVPVLGPACARWGCVFVDRENRERAIATLNGTSALFARGICLFIYPEGTRRRDGRLGEFKKGGFMVALELGLPILPMSVSGAAVVLPSGTTRLRPGRITITVHPPIDTLAYGRERREELMADVRRAIAGGLASHELDKATVECSASQSAARSLELASVRRSA